MSIFDYNNNIKQFNLKVMTKRDWPINPASSGNPPNNDGGGERKKELPEYDDDFFADYVINILNKNIEKNSGIVIEGIEKGTKNEDCLEKVDLWVKFVSIDEPIGVQFTVSGNEDKIEEKRKELKTRNYIAKKEFREDAKIKYSGDANVILVREDKMKLVNYIEIAKRKKIDPVEIPGSEFVRDFIHKIIVEFGIINPARKKMIVDVLIKEASKSKKRK